MLRNHQQRQNGEHKKHSEIEPPQRDQISPIIKRKIGLNTLRSNKSNLGETMMRRQWKHQFRPGTGTADIENSAALKKNFRKRSALSCLRCSPPRVVFACREQNPVFWHPFEPGTQKPINQDKQKQQAQSHQAERQLDNTRTPEERPLELKKKNQISVNQATHFDTNLSDRTILPEPTEQHKLEEPTRRRNHK